MLISAVVPLLVGLVMFFIIGWTTGNKEYGGVETQDDERSQLIKQKAIVSSWVLLLAFLFINFVFDFFNLYKVDSKLIYPELFYLLLLVGSYFVYYWIYSRQLSSNGK